MPRSRATLVAALVLLAFAAPAAVANPPVASIVVSDPAPPAQIFVGQGVKFNATASSADSPERGYRWFVDKPLESTDHLPLTSNPVLSGLFDTPGTHTVDLVVSDEMCVREGGANCFSAKTRVTITVVAKPAAVKTKTTISGSITRRDETAPYEFTANGTVRFPANTCPLGVRRADCVPLNCPKGATSTADCSKRTPAQLCKGNVFIVVMRGDKFVASHTRELKGACSFSATISTPSRPVTTTYTVKVLFDGNKILDKATSKKSALFTAG